MASVVLLYNYSLICLYTYIHVCPCIAAQSDVSLRGKKISTASVGSSTIGGEYLSTTLERRRPSKGVSEIELGM